MLDRAKFLIISEVSEVMRETAASIEGRVDRALERCFVAKARSAPPGKVVEAAPRTHAAEPPAGRAALLGGQAPRGAWGEGAHARAAPSGGSAPRPPRVPRVVGRTSSVRR